MTQMLKKIFFSINIDKNRKHREWRCDKVLRKPKLGGRRDQQSVQANLWKSSSFLFSLSDIWLRNSKCVGWLNWINGSESTGISLSFVNGTVDTFHYPHQIPPSVLTSNKYQLPRTTPHKKGSQIFWGKLGFLTWIWCTNQYICILLFWAKCARFNFHFL